MKTSALLALLCLSTAATAEPLAIHDGRLFVPATVNGVAVEALLDSGAEMTVVDQAFAKEAGIAGGATVEARGTGAATQQARIVEGVDLAALGTDLPGSAVVVMDLGEVSKRLIKRDTRVILGRDLFDARRLRIDLAGKDVHALADGDVAQGVALPLTGLQGIEAVPVTVMGMNAQALIDFGNGSEPSVSRSIVEALHLQTVGTKVGGGIGGAHERTLVRIPEFTVAGHVFRDVVATVDEKAPSLLMNIGTSILQHFVVTADFAGRKAWFAEKSMASARSGR